jgi:hypothetical protein
MPAVLEETGENYKLVIFETFAMYCKVGNFLLFGLKSCWFYLTIHFGFDHESTKFWASIFWGISDWQNSKFLVDAFNYTLDEAAVLGYQTITWCYKFIGSFYCHPFILYFNITLYIENWCATCWVPVPQWLCLTILRCSVKGLIIEVTNFVSGGSSTEHQVLRGEPGTHTYIVPHKLARPRSDRVAGWSGQPVRPWCHGPRGHRRSGAGKQGGGWLAQTGSLCWKSPQFPLVHL